MLKLDELNDFIEKAFTLKETSLNHDLVFTDNKDDLDNYTYFFSSNRKEVKESIKEKFENSKDYAYLFSFVNFESKRYDKTFKKKISTFKSEKFDLNVKERKEVNFFFANGKILVEFEVKSKFTAPMFEGHNVKSEMHREILYKEMLDFKTKQNLKTAEPLLEDSDKSEYKKIVFKSSSDLCKKAFLKKIKQWIIK